MKKIRKYLKKLDSFATKYPYLVLGIILVLPGLMLSIPLPFFETISSWLWDYVFIWIFFPFVRTTTKEWKNKINNNPNINMLPHPVPEEHCTNNYS